MTLAALLDARMNAEEDPQFERHVKQVGNPDGAMDVFDTVDGVENRQNLEHKVPIACFDGEGALVLDTSTPQCAVLQYDEEGKFVRLSASFDQFVNALVKKKPPEPDEEEENASDASDVGDDDE